MRKCLIGVLLFTMLLTSCSTKEIKDNVNVDNVDSITSADIKIDN